MSESPTLDSVAEPRRGTAAWFREDTKNHLHVPLDTLEVGSLAWYLQLRAEQACNERYVYDLQWSELVRPVSDPETFWQEYAWVILNSGMKNTVAQKIWDKVRPAVEGGGSALDVFGHKGKAEAIDKMYPRRAQALREYLAVGDDPAAKLAHLQGLSWIGPTTKYHLAKNYGLDFAKPDRHLERLAGKGFEAVQAFCERIAQQCGDRVATVDLVIWRAASLGLV